ncbi:putative PAP2 superfamily protein [Lyophyllum shimeji]|uniref:PAP2 superfamily protein n=1 Tax=Lyophyllum shimeji TaxID=47721 RepID=A0A9P3PWK3_LYOSH|nr:putative PAP2 superfamily protein [Lyophyllum shimeji]
MTATRHRGGLSRTVNTLVQALVAAVGRLDKSLSPTVTLDRLRKHHFTLADSVHIFHIANAVWWLTLMQVPGYPLKLAIPVLWTLALIIPFTSQFFVPATPIFTYLITYYSSRFIPTPWRPEISVSLLPTLESVLYGANISDILTRFTHPILDIIAWLPYGVGHFIIPFFVAAFLWLFRSKESLHLWARAFGYFNFCGVVIQIFFPCSAPWYELIHGLTPANYTMKGSPGGLARIDALLHSQTYTVGFSNAPVVFGAFPSMHAGCATIEALFIAHFFPQTARYVWLYAGVLYWATMYLTHHYLIDVVGGACLAIAFFYLFLPDDLRGEVALAPPAGLGRPQKSKYEVYDLDGPASRGAMDAAAFDLSEPSSDEEEVDITYRSPNPGTTPNGTAVPVPRKEGGQGKKSHRHTASIASLIRGEERSAEDGWSPVAAAFNIPQQRGGGSRDGSRDRSNGDARR